ncbi:unnamed protein product [Lymnaea stagnalis]|uniref:glutamyl aminopeptidase n=1 Tax=Lymnaea stagnalis TaxID=6523 RepID=A0AAV2H687_LYMST
MADPREKDELLGEVGYSEFTIIEHKPSRRKRYLTVFAVVLVVAAVTVGAAVWRVTEDEGEDSRVQSGADQRNNMLMLGSGGQTVVQLQLPNKPPSEQKPGSTGLNSVEKEGDEPWLSLRLSRDVLPVHYDITIFPDFYDSAGEFYGNETLEVQVVKPTRHFLLHVNTLYMNVTRSQLVDNVTGEDIEISRTFNYLPNEFFVIESKTVVERPVKIKLQFEGSLTKAITGLYKSTYLNTKTNKTRNLATTQFEPTYARQAFPCLDEPNMKAEFTITLVHRPEYIALSNMPQDGQASPHGDSTDLVASKFQRSVRMSTYLVGLIVCDFEFKETTSSNGKRIRVYATPDKVDQTVYALEMAKHTLDTYEVLFQLNYPLPKQDLIAIPDFRSGAMENWGLITFRERNLLYDPEEVSLSGKENVAQVVAHEMSHQWFGDIVTMDWWNDLWLNEGFASYMEYVGVADKEPEWDVMTRFLDKDLFPVMKGDSELASHPIVVDVRQPSEINSAFDDISYNKGSAVIRMLKSIMGDENFNNGIVNYLNKFQWGNAKTDDLWQSLTEADRKHDVKHIMDTWTKQEGFPYVTVQLESNDNGTTTVSLSQERFLADPKGKVDPSKSPFGFKWSVTVNALTSSGVTSTHTMDLVDIKFTENLSLNTTNSWVKFNSGQMGFYCVLYPEDMWKTFSQYLLETPFDNWTLSAADRAGLLNDAFVLAESGKVSYEVALDLLLYLENERHIVPWSTGFKTGTSYIHSMLGQTSDSGAWKKFLRKILKSTISRLGFEDEGSVSDRNLRVTTLKESCVAEDEATLEHIKTQFRLWLDVGTKPSVNLRSIVYQYGMRYGGNEEDWELVWSKYLIESSPQEKELLASALASTQKSELITKLLDNAKQEIGIKRQDFYAIVQLVGSNGAAKDLIWDWARDNYQTFIDRFTITDRNFGQMIYLMVKNYNTEVQLQEVKDFFAKYPEAGAGERSRKMAIESIERNIYWVKTFKPAVVEWLKRQRVTA